jgi:UDP-N-acetylglucosamine/UDP-N-acetylgalactosamine diphosphorylase
VNLKGGFFSGAVFLDGANLGSGAHVREGTILEEEANGAHAVGLKQTLLLPFVTLGSLINFCDVLMAGGSSRKDHSEVGSSYIHFNFTPHQDKATASLIGDVPRGVLLREKPIFLGGQGGLVGPARIAYGSVIAAGGVCRQDVLDENRLHVPAIPAAQTLPYAQEVYKNIGRIVRNNLIYIGNVRALQAWHRTVRGIFLRDDFDRACHQGALDNLDLIFRERLKRLEELAAKLEPSARALEAQGAEFVGIAQEQRAFSTDWKRLRATLEALVPPVADAALLCELASADKSSGYIAAVRGLSESARVAATAWLRHIVDETVAPVALKKSCV